MRTLCKILLFAGVISLGVQSYAQRAITLDDCHRMALEANNNIKILNEKLQAAEEIRKQALSEFFPRFSANAAYLWSEKKVKLLSDEKQDELSHLGDMMSETAVQHLMNHPTLVAQVLSLTGGQLPNLGLREAGNDMGESLAKDLDFNTQNIFVGAVSVMQPVYLGGKIREAYRIARLNRNLAGLSYNKERDDVLIEVDQAYWRVVSLVHKVELAQQYCNLLTDLSNNVDAMVEAEVATRADQTKVRVKLNEAQMNLTKASNGLVLSRMLLFQICGLDLDSNYVVVEDSSLVNYQAYGDLNMNAVWDSRSEIRMLSIADSMAQSAVRIAASGLLPNIMLTGSYLVSNPNLYNGFNNKFGGMFNVGVIANIPLCHPSAIFAVRAAKHKRNETRLQLVEAKEKIELQVHKLNYELEVANKKMTQAQSNLLNAEENLKLASESFAAGVISSSDLMAAQTAWLAAKNDVIDADIEIRLGYRSLRQALGISEL